MDAEVVGDEFDDDATGIISGSAPEFADVKQALAQRDEYLDSLRRLQAEFENYKKRVAKQQSDQVARPPCRWWRSSSRSSTRWIWPRPYQRLRVARRAAP